MTVLEVVHTHDVDIPYLHSLNNLSQRLCCRVYIIEVESSRAPVYSCHPAVARNVVINGYSKQ